MNKLLEPLLTRELGTLNALELSRLLEYTTVDFLSVSDQEKLQNAISFATVLHSKQTRKSRDEFQRTPYIEHPIRNTLRLVRWQVTDVDILIASILHDTLEDTSDVFSKKFLHHSSTYTDINREQLLQSIRDMFGERVAIIVNDVTNPVALHTTENKNELYKDFVTQEIKCNTDTFLVKLSDFVDNACGLPHSTDEKFIAHQIPKYSPLIDVFLDELNNLYHRRLLKLPKQSLNDMEYKLSYTKVRFAEILATQNHQ